MFEIAKSLKEKIKDLGYDYNVETSDFGINLFPEAFKSDYYGDPAIVSSAYKGNDFQFQIRIFVETMDFAQMLDLLAIVKESIEDSEYRFEARA